MSENEKTSPLKNAMNFGAMLGLSAMIISFVLQIAKIRDGALPQVSLLSVFVLFIILGIRGLRTRWQGFISYGQALAQGVLISLFGAILLGFFTYVFFAFASPESIQEIKDIAEIQMENQGLDSEQIEMALEMQSKFMTPGIMGIMVVLTYVFLGTIVSLIASAFLKKDNPNPFA